MIQKAIDMLGYRGRDKVTGFDGVITSVCFDLYGCVQFCLCPQKESAAKLGESYWFDVQRVAITSDLPVMAQPEFGEMARTPSEYSFGAAEKPAPKQ